jgi:hypothetical protein
LHNLFDFGLTGLAFRTSRTQFGVNFPESYMNGGWYALFRRRSCWRKAGEALYCARLAGAVSSDPDAATTACSAPRHSWVSFESAFRIAAPVAVDEGLSRPESVAHHPAALQDESFSVGRFQSRSRS